MNKQICIYCGLPMLNSGHTTLGFSCHKKCELLFLKEQEILTEKNEFIVGCGKMFKLQSGSKFKCGFANAWGVVDFCSKCKKADYIRNNRYKKFKVVGGEK